MPLKRLAPLAMLLLASLPLAAQAGDRGHGHGGAGHASGPHEVRGIYLGHDPAEGRISVAHEAIPEVMMAMRMNLHLVEGEPLPDLAEGDKVAFRMIGRATTGMSWFAEGVERLPDDTELVLPAELRERIGH
ncbi:copper-binding protein [Halomonas sp. C05BenzN]|uniref:copper-binding protein n=1 Tax=Halomonas sp. C05BenzN TaxID=3411041 RepID=UPI003B942EC7